ncbi:MAG TPA: hypothetical protein VNF48_06560 [Gammaproteobacteria bacterium]|nr:hypothetical protein [Gammaproteobacteria bacterium]
MMSKPSQRYLRQLAAVLLFSLAACSTANADDFFVYSPYVVQGQSELEFLGHSYQDSSPTVSGEYAYQFSAAHAFTSWWKPEIYFGVYQHSPGGPQTLVAREFENLFQFTAPGEYWVDIGFLASYEYATQPGATSVLEFGPLFEKHSGHFVQKLNFIWEKQLGGGAENNYAFRTTYSLSYQLRRWFAPGAEIYLRPHDNAYQIGPVLYGELVSAKGSEIEYSVGVVFGANPGAPNQTFVLRLEYEFF